MQRHRCIIPGCISLVTIHRAHLIFAGEMLASAARSSSRTNGVSTLQASVHISLMRESLAHKLATAAPASMPWA